MTRSEFLHTFNGLGQRRAFKLVALLGRNKPPALGPRYIVGTKIAAWELPYFAPSGLTQSKRATIADPGRLPISANLTPRGVLMSVRMSGCAGPEGRQRVAHGVSRGIEEPSDYFSPGGAAEAPTPDLSPLPGL